MSDNIQSEVNSDPTLDFQKVLGDGHRHYFLQLHPLEKDALPLIVTGYTLDITTNYLDQVSADRVNEAEYAYERDVATRNLTKGLVYCQAYSEVVPEGELGFIHISKMVPIEQEVFDILQAANFHFWDRERGFPEADKRKVQHALMTAANAIFEQMTRMGGR